MSFKDKVSKSGYFVQPICLRFKSLLTFLGKFTIRKRFRQSISVPSGTGSDWDEVNNT